MENKYVIGFLILFIASASVVYIQLTDQVKIRVDVDKTTFYVPHETYPWIWTVSGIEENRLFDGSSLMNRDRSETRVSTIVDNLTEEVWIIRETRYIRGPLIRDTYFFDGDIGDVEQFPVSHTVEIFNASGKFYRYTVDRLSDTGPKRKLTGETALSFGKNMKVEFEPNYRWAWIGWPYGADSFSVQYDIESDYETFNVRLFDPPPNIEFVSPTPANATITSDTNVTINVSIAVEVLDEVKFNWNGTNFTIFNNSLVLMMNLDNVNALGENDTHVVDLSGFGNNGTVLNESIFNTTGRYGGAFEFNASFSGVNDYIDLGNGKFDFTNITVCVWINPDDLGADRRIVTSGSENSNLWALTVTSSSTVTMINQTASYTSPDTSVLNTNQWYHICGLTDPNQIYLDGILQTATRTEGWSFEANSKIGSRGTTFNFDGTIDEVRIWNSSLTAAEIQQLYFTNLQKVNSTQWYLYVNQSLNSTDGLTDGIYTYQAFAQDDAGNLSQTEERTITVDTTPPNINFVSPTPANGTTTSNPNVTINISITEANLNEVIFNWNGTNHTFFNDSTVLMMNFDNVSALGENNTHIVDISGNGNNGTVGGGNVTTTDTQFNIGRSLQFDGIDDFVNLTASNQIITNDNDWAIELRFKKEGNLDISTSERLVTFRRGATGSAVIIFFLDGTPDRLQATYHNGAGFIDIFIENLSNLGNEWHHVEFTYDGTIFRTYLDGEPKDTSTDTFSGFGSGIAHLGYSADAFTQFLEGKIDELQIRNAISSADVLESSFKSLRKHDTDKWLLYVNQTLNSTAGLDDGVYTYQSFAKDNIGNVNQTEERTITIAAGLDLNFSIWNGTAYVGASTLSINFACEATQTQCEPTNQDVGSSQSIYQVCNNGTLIGDIDFKMDAVCPNIALLCDDDFTPAGAITLSTINQEIHTNLAVSSCVDISCWADYSNPTAGCFFNVNATIIDAT